MKYDAQGFVTAEDGTHLFYGTRGDGDPALVLCDGIGCDGFAWKYLQPHFARSHQVIHPHYRGHGRSGPPRDRARLDVPALARDMLTVLDHLRVERAVFLGHSMGTQVELEVYRLAPERVVGLVLLCGSSGHITHTFHGTDLLRQILPAVNEATQRRHGLARALWSRVPAKLAYRLARLSGEVDANTIREEDFTWYWNHVAMMDPEVFLAMLRLAGEHSADDILDRITVPTLVLAADRDTFTPYDVAKGVANRIPGAELQTLEGGSHAAPVEQPHTIAAYIDDFLGRAIKTEPTQVPG